MPNRTTPVEWHVAESDAEWQRLSAPETPDLAPGQRRLVFQRFLGSVALLLCLLTVVWWRMNRGGVQQQEGVRGPVSSPDDRGLQPGREVSGSHATLQNMESPAYVLAAGQPLTVQGDQAWGRVVMYTEHGEPAYRQTRF
jgi:hypothetical protein